MCLNFLLLYIRTAGDGAFRQASRVSHIYTLSVIRSIKSPSHKSIQGQQSGVGLRLIQADLGHFGL